MFLHYSLSDTYKTTKNATAATASTTDKITARPFQREVLRDSADPLSRLRSRTTLGAGIV